MTGRATTHIKLPNATPDQEIIGINANGASTAAPAPLQRLTAPATEALPRMSMGAAAARRACHHNVGYAVLTAHAHPRTAAGAANDIDPVLLINWRARRS